MTMRVIEACHWSPGIVGIQPADVHGARAHRGGVVRHPEMQRLEPSAEAARSSSTLAMPSAVSISASSPTLRVCRPHGLLDLVDHRLDHVEVRRHAHLGHQERVHPVAGLLHDVDHVAIHVVGVETVDADRHGLAACAAQSMSFSASMAFLRACSFSGGATASSRSRKT
jgi:hypothetical protein